MPPRPRRRGVNYEDDSANGSQHEESYQDHEDPISTEYSGQQDGDPSTLNEQAPRSASSSMLPNADTGDSSIPSVLPGDESSNHVSQLPSQQAHGTVVPPSSGSTAGLPRPPALGSPQLVANMNSPVHPQPGEGSSAPPHVPPQRVSIAQPPVHPSRQHLVSHGQQHRPPAAISVHPSAAPSEMPEHAPRLTSPPWPSYDDDAQKKEYEYHGSNNWSADGSWKKTTTPDEVGQVVKDVNWTTPVLGHPWEGQDDITSLSEFHAKLIRSTGFTWSDPRWRYFLLRHNLSIDLQRLLDCHEEDSPVDPSQFRDPYSAHSDYWSTLTEGAWNFLGGIYNGSDGDQLEDRWTSLWLEKGTTFLKFWSRFESLSREVARSRKVPRLSEQELRCRMYQAVPTKCKSYLDERGYRQPGVMSYKQLTEATMAWCGVHWDHHKHSSIHAITAQSETYPVANPPYDSKPYPGNTSTSVGPTGATWSSSATNRPRVKRQRDDSTILQHPLNKVIIESKCGRCLSSDGHTAATCCGSVQHERCLFCGLVHVPTLYCPRDYDTFGKECMRCGKKNHSAWCCKAASPSVVAAVTLNDSGNHDNAISVRLNKSSHAFQALLDSGAQACVITMEALTKVPEFNLTPTTVSLITADGGHPTVIGVAKAITVLFDDNHSIRADFVVVSSTMTRDVILSVNALKDLDAIWLLGRNQLVLGSEASHLAGQLGRGHPLRPPSAVLQPALELCNIAIDHSSTTVHPDLHGTDILPEDLLQDLINSTKPKAKKSTPVAAHSNDEDLPQDTTPDSFTWELLPSSDDASHGRFKLHIPWKSDERPTSSSKDQCLRRALATDARLSAKQRGDYLEVVSSLFKNNFVVDAASDVIHFIPAKPVFRDHAASTKTRLVLDPSGELNPLCHTGPPATDNYIGGTLLTNLHLSRASPYIVTGDVSKAFHQIVILELDQGYFGMIVRYGKDHISAKWRVLIFGANFAPSALNQALTCSVVLADYDSGYLSRQQAMDLDPVVAQVIDTYDNNKLTASVPVTTDSPAPRLGGRVSIYVDDTQCRGDDIESVTACADALDASLLRNGFGTNVVKRVRSWCMENETSYLGYHWDDDCYFIRFKKDVSIATLLAKDKLTRREIFKLAMSFYDPLGLAVEYSASLRMLVRLSFPTADDWDSFVDDKYSHSLIALIKGIIRNGPQSTRSPRAVSLSTLNVFSDASGEASSFCLHDANYVRIYAQSHLWTVTQQNWTMPKKETICFCDAVAATYEYLSLLKRLHYKFDTQQVCFYLDSSCTVYRVRRLRDQLRLKVITPLEVRRLRQTLEHLSEITAMGIAVTVKHLPGRYNPADRGTRPITSGDLPTLPIPSEIKANIELADFADVSVKIATPQQSSATPKTVAILQVDEHPCARDLENQFPLETIRQLQQDHARTYNMIHTLTHVTTNEVPANLRLYSVSDGILYFHGCTSVANSRSEKALPVLPPTTPAINCLRDLHDAMGHPPASATVTLFQTFYYLPKLRAHLRRIIGDCDTCQRKRRRNAYRSQGGVVQPPGLSFDVGNVVVVDLQGPLVDPCAPASDAKNWILTILDPVSFSVDYDVLNYPTTSLIINALERNFAVRGIPMVLVSDVGSTFTSAPFLYFLRSWNVRSCWLPRDARGYGGFHERYHGQLLEQIRARLLDASHLPDPIPLRTIVAESVSALNRLPLYDLGGISAHELHYCRRPRYPIGIEDSDENSVTLDKLKNWLPSLCILDPQREVLHDELATMANEVATRRCSSLLNFWDLWCERSDRVRQRFEKLPLPRATLLRYKPGDLVLKFRRGSLKQQSCWSGPFRVVDSSESNTLYRLETLDGRRLRYLETVFNLRRYTPPVDNVDSYAYNPDEAPIPEAPLQEAGNDDDDLVYLNL